MKGLLCNTTAKTNEEYRQVVKVRMYRFLCLGFIGSITLAIALLTEFYWKLDVNEHMLGVYTGVGAGLLAASIALWIKNKRLLGNEEKLKESRISNADERIQEISSRAFKMAAIVMLVAMYAVALIGGLFYPVLVEMLLAIISVFAFTYVVAYFAYSKRM